MIAQALQQCADTGTPDFADLADFVAPIVGKEDLELQPANSKSWERSLDSKAVQRQGQEALVLARRAAEQWRERGDHGNASYPVCTWLVTAGLLGYSGELEQAKLVAEWAQQGGTTGSVYVLLALGRGASSLATSQGLAIARTHLWAILQAQHSQTDAGVRAIAARHLLAAKPSPEQKAFCLAELGLEVGGLDVVTTTAATPAAVLAQLACDVGQWR